jgi:hypothetical protein
LHHPYARRYKDRNPTFHEEPQKGVALTHDVHFHGIDGREHIDVDRRPNFFMHVYLSDRKERESAAPVLEKCRTATKIAKRSTRSTAIYRSQPTPVIKSTGVIVMNIFNERRAKGGRSAYESIKLNLLSPIARLP